MSEIHSRCRLCGEHFGSHTGDEFEDSHVCSYCFELLATPEFLNYLARWFDDPSRTPTVLVRYKQGMSAGMALREMASALTPG